MNSMFSMKTPSHFVGSWNASRWTSTAIVVALIIVYGIYEIYLHPLSGFPGPISCKLCNARYLYYALRGENHLDIQRCHQKYGPVIRYTPSTVIWNSTVGLRDIYGVRRRVRKTPNYRFLDQGIANILTLSDKDIHAGRRRMLNPSFTETAVKAFQPKLLYHVQRFCSLLYPSEAQSDATDQPPWGPVMNMSDWCAYLTFDLMTELVFGKGSNLLGKPKNRELVPMAEVSFDWVAVLYYLPLPYPGTLTRFLFRFVNRRYNIFNRYIESNFKARYGLRPEDLGGDVFSHLVYLRATSSKEKLTRDEIQSECQLLSVAGFDTLSTALCATIFYLAHCPHAYTRLADEIRTEFPSTADIQTERLKACKYLNACINESLRISPPICALVPREVEKGGEIIDGNWIPESYVVGTSIYAIQRNPEYFPEPHRYLPERWLTTNDTPANAAFEPFSTGPRACIGKSIALSELQTTIAFLMRSFDFKLAEGHDGMTGRGGPHQRPGRRDPTEFQLHDRMTTRVEGPKIQLRPISKARGE